MSGNIDAKRIGVELQTLLKIPPINKLLDGGTKDVVERPSVQQPRAGMSVISDVEINGRHVKLLTKESPKVQIKAACEIGMGPTLQAGPPPQNFNGGPRTGGNYDDGSLAFTLRKPDCPRDIQMAADTFLEYARGERAGGPLSPKLKLMLSIHYIEVLAKKSNKYPRAKFFCNHCNYHMDNINATITHVMGARHAAFEHMKKVEVTLTKIPGPSVAHSANLTRFLSETCLRYAIHDTELERRRMYVHNLNQEVKAANLGCTLSLYGSSRTSLGFKDSDININISVHDKTGSVEQSTADPVTTDSGDILQKLFLFFQHHMGCIEVKKIVSSKSAKIHYRESEKLCEVVLSMNNNVGVGTANLLIEYCKLNPLVRVLTIALRVWAKFCEIDSQDNGYLPPHAFAIMVVYFLQHRKMLPNLHVLQENMKGAKSERSYLLADEACQFWKYQPISPDQYGSVWLDLIRYYAIEFDYRDTVISISHLNLRRSEKYWNRKISIEDPMIPKSNLSRCMSNNRMCDYIVERFKFSYLYFGVPRTIRGPLYDEILVTEGGNQFKSNIFHKAVPRQGVNYHIHSSDKKLMPISNIKWDPISLTEEVKHKKWLGTYEFPPVELESVEIKLHTYMDVDHKVRTSVLPQGAIVLDNILPEWLYHYVFETDVLQNGQKPPLVCKCCGTEGHLRADCPEEALPVLRPVMNATPAALRLLSEIIRMNYEKETLDDRDIQIRTRIVREIEDALLPLLPGAEFKMFGSTYNGFGVHQSDVDVCLTFRNRTAAKFNETIVGEESAAVVVLRVVLERLKAGGYFQDVISIPSAKVPIVKFRHRTTNLEGDISCYNILAMHNTELLRTYTELDMRVKILGCFLKKVTKLCDISDASRGSLSSYGYVLMAIHYFQHTQLPVLPVLQELDRENLASIEVDGCDVQYFKDLPNLKYIWPHYGKNRQSLGELWLGFLNYYVEVFNFEEHVVTINQFAPLTRVSKLWLTDSIAIEDPYDRSHNLGAGLSRRMSIHILKTFHHLRQFFHSNHDAMVLRRHKDWLSYFTDPKLLQNGNPPLDRQCRICHKIGHIARNCGLNDRNDHEGTAAKEDSPPPDLKVLVEHVKHRLSLNPANVVKNIDMNREGKPLNSSKPSPAKSLESSVDLPEAVDPQSTSNAFPHFFGAGVQFGSDDTVIQHMIAPLANLRVTPGVEFAIPNETDIKEATTFRELGSGDSPQINRSTPNFHDSLGISSIESHHGHPLHGLAFAKPGFHPINVQILGNPNLPPVTAPPPGFAPLPPSVQIVRHPGFIHNPMAQPIQIGIHPFQLVNSAASEMRQQDHLRFPQIPIFPTGVERLPQNPSDYQEIPTVQW